MGLLDRIARPTANRSVSGLPSFGLIPPLGSVQSASGLLISQATAMSVAAVYRAVYVRSTDVARCTPSVFSEQKDGTREKLKGTDHAIAALMLRPNRVQTYFEFIRDLWVAYLLRGNAYAAILRDARGEPRELLPINPDAVMILEAVDGQWFYNVNRIGLFQMAMLRDLPIAIPAEDILHFRGISFNMLVGASTIGLARDAIGLNMAQSQQQSRWIGNGARPSVVLESKNKLNDQSAARLKKSWEDFSAGIQNVGRTAVLEDGVTAKSLQLTGVDLQFIDQCNLSIQDVARFFGVPVRKLMQADTSKGSSIIQEDQSYINETVSPDLSLIEQKMVVTFDLDKEGLGVDLDETPLLRADPLTRYNVGRIGILSGMVSTNEWRRGEKLPPVEGGDEVRAPVNLAALGSDMTGTAPDGAGRPGEGQGPKPGVPNQSDNAGNDTAKSSYEGGLLRMPLRLIAHLEKRMLRRFEDPPAEPPDPVPALTPDPDKPRTDGAFSLPDAEAAE
jgi:HK97 family phage portal protein